MDKITKEELKRPDVFLSTMDRGVGLAEKHSTTLAIIIGLLFVGALGYVLVDFTSRRSERTASEDLYKIEADYMKLRDQYQRAKYEAANPKDAKAPKQEAPATPASGDLQKDYGTVLPGLEKVADEHPSKAAGAQAAVMAADVYLEYKQAAKALTILDKVADHQKPTGLMYAVTHLMQGTALAETGDCTKAIGAWQKVIDNKTAVAFQPDALLKSGVCYETLNQNDKAAEFYRRITVEHAETSAATTAKTYLRMIEAKLPSSGAKAG